MPPKSHRLSGKQLRICKKKGSAHRFPGFTLIISSQSPSLDHSRSGIITSQRLHRRAVIRNRTRRRVYPYLKTIRPGVDIIFIPAPPMLKWANEVYFSEINQALSKLSLV